MLDKLNKFASFIAIGVIGYLTYSALSEPSSNLIEQKSKDPVEITKKMLSPVLIQPQADTSWINRDPFETGKENYTGSSQYVDVNSSLVDEAKSSGELMGILTDDDGHALAFIGGKIYSAGSQVQLPDSPELWQIDSIEDESVLLRCNGQETVLRIINKLPDYNDTGTVLQSELQAKEQRQ